MNPEEIPQMLRDIADVLEQLLGGAVQGTGAEQAPVNLEAMQQAPQGGQQ